MFGYEKVKDSLFFPKQLVVVALCTTIFCLYGMKRIKKQAKDCHTQSAPPCVRCSKPSPWLKEVDAHVLQSSLKDLGGAFDKFFKKQNAYPRFKKKASGAQSYRTNLEKNNQLPHVSILKAIDLNSQSSVGFVLLIAERLTVASLTPR